eukprot:s3216_g2.t1
MISEGYSDPRTLARRVSKMEKWLESPTLLEADKEAEYAAVININLDELKEPVLCCPNDPDDAKTLTEIGTAGIDEVFIGSCMTNIGHYRAAGKMLSQFDGQLSTRLWIAPPTKMDEEWFDSFSDRCMCKQARVADNATVVSTSTRNFPNRLGKGANVYLASAELASVAAILGRLPTKEEYLKLGMVKYHAELAKNEDSIYKYLNFDQEEQEEDEEPIPFAETVWNVALVLGFTDAGWLDIILTLILACMSAFMQSLFVVVILSPSFLGEPFESEIQIARTWRANIAHDSKYKDLADTSLASRVCNGDGSLIQSTVQANLLSEIDSFLGISATGEPFEPSNLQPGTILSGLCILLWCIYLCKEFRAIWVSVEAALQIPRAHVTIFKTGRFVTISWRRLGVYLTLRLARTAVAGCLLYAGIQWLARTTNIADLILNAVALGAILEIDEMIFVSLLPKKVQVAIYELEAIQEGLFIFIMVATLSLAPFFMWVQPLSQTMIAVKKEYCANNQDFVMAFNEDVLAGVGTLIVGIGATVGILGLSQAAAIADDPMLVEGSTGNGRRRVVPQFHVATNASERLWIHETGCWPEPLDYHGVSLYQFHALDARDTEGRNGTFAVTSGYRTWVVDGTSDHAPRLHRLLYHRQAASLTSPNPEEISTAWRELSTPAEQQLPMGFDTVPFANVSVAFSLGELAVGEHAKGNLANGSVSKFISFAPDADTFAANLAMTMEDLATRFPFCLDADQWPTAGPVLVAGYGPHFRSAAAMLQREDAQTCAELADKCEDPSSRLLRLVCGRTCQCHEPLAYPWFKVPSQGCSGACRTEALSTANSRPCEDMPINTEWLRFWDNYLTVMSHYTGQDMRQVPEAPTLLSFVEFMKESEMGCLGLAVIGETEPITKANWCEGNPRYWPPLAHLCPVSCSCAASENPADYCPSSCRACGDAPVFPSSGPVTNCAEAKAAGICGVPADAAEYCSGTCGLCNETNVSLPTAPCVDGVLPPSLGLHNCSYLQARGWCRPLALMNSPLSNLCGQSCGTCS